MADINSEPLGGLGAAPARRAELALPVADPRLIAVVELLFFAYRDFTREADAVLAEFGLGRAHHRVLHFVNRNPGLRIADLLEILKITKQSLARVLKQLVDEGWIAQQAGVHDRRERLLRVTAKGADLARRLDQLQAKRVAGALAACGADHEPIVRGFLYAMISVEERSRVNALLPKNNPASAAGEPGR
jgi:DNA-binding MarR family transcriptional regulator